MSESTRPDKTLMQDRQDVLLFLTGGGKKTKLLGSLQIIIELKKKKKDGRLIAVCGSGSRRHAALLQ